MSLNTLAISVHATSKSKGFWPKAHNCNIDIPHTCGHGPCDFKGRDPGEVLMLIVTEASEAMEAVRDDNWSDSVTWFTTPQTPQKPYALEFSIQNGVQYVRGVAVGEPDWSPITPELAAELHLVPKPEGVPSELADIIIRTLDAAAAWGIDIDTAVRQKIRYNATRGILHGRAR